MQTLMLIGLLAYYAVVAAAFDWFLPKNSLWFTTFLAVVASQTLLFGGDYFYRGYWESWNAIALVTSGTICIVTSAVVAIVFHLRRSRTAGAPT